jgi:hypothetical protein
LSYCGSAASAGSTSLQTPGRATAAAAVDYCNTTFAAAAAFRQRLQVPILITHHTADVTNNASRLQLLDLLVAALCAAEDVVQLLVLCTRSRNFLFGF